MKILRYDFSGPFDFISDLLDAPGVFLIGDTSPDGDWKLLDVDEAESVKTSIVRHPRQPHWNQKVGGSISYAVRYMANSSRVERQRVVEDVSRGVSVIGPENQS